MNSENTKTFDPHRQQLNISDKANLEKNGKTKRKRNEFKLSAPTREEKIELSG